MFPFSMCLFQEEYSDQDPESEHQCTDEIREQEGVQIEEGPSWKEGGEILGGLSESSSQCWPKNRA